MHTRTTPTYYIHPHTHSHTYIHTYIHARSFHSLTHSLQLTPTHSRSNAVSAHSPHTGAQIPQRQKLRAKARTIATKGMMCDVWCVMWMMYDVWCMMYDVWCMMYDVWCMMYDKRNPNVLNTVKMWNTKWRKENAKVCSCVCVCVLSSWCDVRLCSVMDVLCFIIWKQYI